MNSINKIHKISIDDELSMISNEIKDNIISQCNRLSLEFDNKVRKIYIESEIDFRKMDRNHICFNYFYERQLNDILDESCKWLH